MDIVAIFCLSACLLVHSLNALPTYQDLIPNGKNVHHPCKANSMWAGVGHSNPLGGGVNNQFGLDWKAAEHKWTPEFCRTDSDGDNRTNGEELGDPQCVWTPGQIPARTDNITHPGVCEPMNSSLCTGKNSFVSCTQDAFERCDSIRKPNVTFMDLRFPTTTIPAKVTTYYCMTFNLMNDTDFHIVANEALINNSNVIHHMLLFACADGDDFVLSSPTECGMSSSRCALIIGGWTVGLKGSCFGPVAGYRIGLTGVKKVRLEVHYNNPKKVSNYTDNSGLRLYIQPAVPEVQDMATLVTGQTDIQIPPGRTSVDTIGVLPSRCTSQILRKSIFITGANNHMHYYGQAMKVELFRNGTKVRDITNDVSYSYDWPVAYSFDPPIEMKPGDEIKTTCNYNSLKAKEYVFYGESTADEMCFAFLNTYPMDAFLAEPICDSDGPFSPCDFNTGAPVAGCDWKAFVDDRDPNVTDIFVNLANKCNLNGLCRPECQEYINTIKDHPCLYGPASGYVKRRLQRSYDGLATLGRLHSCPTTTSAPTNSCQQEHGNSSPSATKKTSTMFTAVSVSVIVLLSIS